MGQAVVSSLNKIIELSSSMLEAARNGDWERVQSLEQQRKSIFDQVFPLDTDSIKDVPAVTKQVQEIYDLDKEIMVLASKSHKEFSEVVGKIATGRQAVNAYRNVAGR
jgi:hypothetical protein